MAESASESLSLQVETVILSKLQGKLVLISTLLVDVV